MLHIGRWMELEAVDSFSKPGGSMLDTDIVVLLKISRDALGWLGDQLSAGWPGLPQGDVAAAVQQTVLQQLLAQHAGLNSALEAAAQKLNTQAVSGFASLAGLQLLSRVVKVDKDMQQQVVSCWQQLQGFAAAVIDEFPTSSSCGNPECLAMAKLSEWQLMGGKTCVCNGCGVARYCNRACQVLMWAKHHKPVCKRLQAARAAAA
jgi:hypothetical protein